MIMRNGADDGARRAALVIRREHYATAIPFDNSFFHDLTHRAVGAFDMHVGLDCLEPAYRCRFVEYKDRVD